MGMRRGRRARRDCIGIHTHENVGARLVAEAERSRRDPDAFPAHAGPWLDVRFERPAAAARFARNVRNVLGYRATVDPANPRLVVTNAARWEISDLLVRTNTGRASSPLSREEHAPRARDPKQQRLFGDAGHGQLDLYSTVDPDVTIAYLDRGVRTIVRLRRSEARAFLRTLPKGAWTTETRRIAREVAVRAGRDHARRRVRRRDPGRKNMEYRGFRIDPYEGTSARPATYAGLRRGEMTGGSRKERGYLIHLPDGGTKFVTTMKRAREYVDNYLG